MKRYGKTEAEGEGGMLTINTKEETSQKQEEDEEEEEEEEEEEDEKKKKRKRISLFSCWCNDNQLSLHYHNILSLYSIHSIQFLAH